VLIRRITLSAVTLVVVVIGGCASGHDTPSTSGRADQSPLVRDVFDTQSGGFVSGYRPPVSAPIIDRFRPPPGRFAAGNRGIEYETTPESPVGAIGAGRVVFAGSVAGSLHVTVTHPDGLRSSYSYLASTSVAVGEEVVGGQMLGTTTARLHVGVRAGTAYLDPALLFSGAGVHLVPVR
jgi:murein DD-endopeptidase MepM/ murein hydrolase activator NlpD